MDNVNQDEADNQDSILGSPSSCQEAIRISGNKELHHHLHHLTSALPLVTISRVVGSQEDDPSAPDTSGSSGQTSQVPLADLSPSSGESVSGGESGANKMIPKSQNAGSFPFLHSPSSPTIPSHPPDPSSIYSSLIDSENESKKSPHPSSPPQHEFLLHPLNPHLPLHVLLQEDDSQSNSSDSSDLPETDSEDEDVISVPLRGRTISYVRSALCHQHSPHPAGRGNGKCKTIDAFSMDFKLKVLEWAYTKTIHSAGHHFNLERCVVRNWMMNEEKIVLLASSKGRRKWARYDQRQRKHKEISAKYSRTKPLDARILKAIGGLRVSGNRS